MIHVIEDIPSHRRYHQRASPDQRGDESVRQHVGSVDEIGTVPTQDPDDPRQPPEEEMLVPVLAEILDADELDRDSFDSIGMEAHHEDIVAAVCEVPRVKRSPGGVGVGDHQNPHASLPNVDLAAGDLDIPQRLRCPDGERVG